MSLLMVLLTFLSEAYVLWWMGDNPACANKSDRTSEF